MFEIGKFRKDVLNEFRISNRVSFELTKVPVRIYDNGLDLYNFIFVNYEGSYYTISELEDVFNNYTFNYRELQVKTHYLDYNFLSRYATKYSKFTKVENIFPSDRVKFPQNVIIPYIHIKYAQLPIHEYIRLIEYIFSEPISNYLFLFDRFLSDIASASKEFLKIKDEVEINKIMVIDGMDRISNKNTIFLNETTRVRVPSFNLTTLMYTLYTYKLSYMTFIVDNPTSEFINIEDSFVVVPTIYDANVTIINTNLLKSLEKPMTSKIEFLSNIFETLVETEPKKLFYSLNYNIDDTFFIDLGELIIGYTRFGVEKGIVFLRKYVQNGKVYLRIIPDFTRAITDEYTDKKNIYMSIDKLEQFVSGFSKGVTSFFIDPNLNRLFIVHYPYNEQDKTYYTEVQLSGLRNKIGLVNGYLVIGNHKFKIFDTYGYVNVLKR